MSNDLYMKHNYVNRNLVYLKNNIIREYDMVNAGINILHHHKVLSDEEYVNLNQMDKLAKNIVVGKFLKKNPDINEALMNEFINIRKDLFEVNGIQDDDILSIKKDAVFIINKRLNNLQLNEDYLFQEKNKYSGYINIDRKEFYYNIEQRKFDIKGYSKDIKAFHENYLFKELEQLMYLDMNNEKNMVFESLIKLKYDFVERNLDKGYYLDLTQGKYIFQTIGSMLSLDDIDDELKQYCFINNNLNFILRVISTLIG
jgi:hypothetical protein